MYACNLSDEWLLNLMAALSADQITFLKPRPMIMMVFAISRLAKTHFHATRFIYGMWTEHSTNKFNRKWLIRICFPIIILLGRVDHSYLLLLSLISQFLFLSNFHLWDCISANNIYSRNDQFSYWSVHKLTFCTKIIYS